MNNALQIAIGEEVGKLLSLKFKTEGDRTKTTWGTKTKQGLGACIQRIVEEQTAMYNEEPKYMQTNQDYTIPNYRGYGKITVPKGTRVTHRTAMGIDPKYHFVDDLNWIETNYPEIDRLLKMDVSTYGIDVPVEYIDKP